MLKKVFLFLLFTVSAAFLSATLLGYFARWVTLAEYLVSFRPHLCMGGLALILLSILAKHRISLHLAVSIFLLNGVEIAPYLIPHQQADRSNLSVLFYNVDRVRVQYLGLDAVLRVVQNNQADLVVLREVGEQPAEQLLNRFSDIYPYSLAYQHARHDGVLILSKIPLYKTEITQLGGGRQVALANFEIECQQVHLVAPHPTNPYHGIAERNKQLGAITDYVDQAPRPMVIVGDLNVTMWSSWYKQIERAGVRNARLGNGIQPTWRVPGFGFQVPFVYFPLDHILISDEVETFEMQRLPALGSDHQPIFVELLFPDKCAA